MTSPAVPSTARPPKVSVFIPCYNYARYVGKAMESVLSQTDPDLELIVVDNGSTDDSWSVIQGFRDPRVRSFRIEKNEGVFPAWALGLEQSRGEWFSLLSADDYLAPRKHETLLRYLTAHPETDAVAAYVEQVDEQGARVPEKDRWMESVINQPHDLNNLDMWTMRHHVCIPTALYRRSLCSVPASGITGASDYYFHLRLLRRGCHFACVPEVTAFYRHHDQNTSVREQSTAVLQFAFCYATQFWPWLQESGQTARATDAVKQIFQLYPLQLQATTQHHLGCTLLCLFWPDWVVRHSPEYHLLAALDWENRDDCHPFHALRVLMDQGIIRWGWQPRQERPADPMEASGPAESSSSSGLAPKRRLREAGRRLERKVRLFLRGQK